MEEDAVFVTVMKEGSPGLVGGPPLKSTHFKDSGVDWRLLDS